MKNVQNALGVKNICDLILKEIYSIYETKSLTKEQIEKYDMTETKIFEKYDNLSEDELNTKNNKNFYFENDHMTAVIKRCRGEKKRDKRKIDGLRKNLMIPESEMPEWKMGNNFLDEKILEEYSVKIYKIDP